MKLTVVAIVKDEADSILEWIAFHRVVGVDKFIVVDNGSADGTRELLLSLAQHEWLSLIEMPSVNGVKQQIPAYNRVLNLGVDSEEILAFIDADEFLVPQPGTDVKAALSQLFVDPAVGAVAVNWKCFGSSSQLFREDGLVIERFKRCASASFGVNHHYKTLVRANASGKFTNPHHVSLASGRYVQTDGAALVTHPKFGLGLSAEKVWDNVCIHHYVVKSLEEFLLGKHRRGSASKSGRVKYRTYFEKHDRNDDMCEDAALLTPKVLIELELLKSLCVKSEPPKVSGMFSRAIGYLAPRAK